MKSIYYLFFLFLIYTSCDSAQEAVKYNRISNPPLNGIRIAWDYSSMQQLAEKGGYPRLKLLKDNSLIAVYDANGNHELIRSYDSGITWTEPVITFRKFTYTNSEGKSTIVNMANSEIFQLANGDLILGCNYRPLLEEIAPFAIAIMRSTDNGLTWKEPQVLYEAAPRFIDGCWEPAFLQLPNGNLQVYFANENPYQKTDEQEISMLESTDNGINWTTNSKTISFRAGRRDGMPVPQLIGDEIVLTIEDNFKDQFKPYTIRTTINDNWSSPVLADSPNRKYALSKQIPDNFYLGAPYSLHLPSGETLISYQTTEGRTTNWEVSTMEVVIGNNQAQNFEKEKATRPFEVPTNKEAKWNSIALVDNFTIAALSSTNFKSNEVAPWMIKGHIISEIVAEIGIPKEYPLFVGSKDKTNLHAGFGQDKNNLYFNCIVNDDFLYTDKSDLLKSDGVYIYLDAKNASLKMPDKGIFRIWFSHTGAISFWEGKEDKWIEIKNSLVKSTISTLTKGYKLNITIPKETLGELNPQAIRLDVALSAYNNSNDYYLEHTANSISDAPYSWIKIKF